ncbi:MAG: CGNR zinc finger domain-containing protein [Alphaproteobacteria bacterium]|nr:CGNR zinc finger domain-containing protein [Alphaproteobacteria bacterium]
MTWSADDLIAEHRGLDFLNTVEDIDKTRSRTQIPDWPTALSWLQFAGILSAPEVTVFARDAGADRAFAALIDFRERAHHVFSAIAAARGTGDAVPPALPRDFEADIRDAIACARPDPATAHYAWQVDPDRAGADLARYRIVLMLWDLLQGPELARLKECGRCSWLFLDKARGVGRRWCRMSACGNRAKAERYRKSHAG